MKKLSEIRANKDPLQSLKPWIFQLHAEMPHKVYFNFVKLSDTARWEITDWCNKEIGKRAISERSLKNKKWHCGLFSATFHFRDEQDAIHFKLRWIADPTK